MLQILLAEDNPADVLLVRRALKQHNIEHQLHVVKDGAEALEFMDNMGKPGNVPCPDLMLLDLNMPKVDGPQVLKEFRKNDACVHTPVIVVTSSDTPKERLKMSELGVACYFRKPLELAAFMQLGAVVGQVLNGSL